MPATSAVPRGRTRSDSQPWWSGEDIVYVAALRDHLPARADGERLRRETCYRYFTAGVHGVVMRRFLVGRYWATTRQEIDRWCAAVTDAMAEVT